MAARSHVPNVPVVVVVVVGGSVQERSSTPTDVTGWGGGTMRDAWTACLRSVGEDGREGTVKIVWTAQSSGCGRDLSTSTLDGIGVEGDIEDAEAWAPQQWVPPSWAAHWKPPMTESLISFRY